ncbi:MAG TPA: hypothetical protein PLF96_04250 [Thermotogota bacterium]|nr:hypothetical protein [Thermotogota bacterium]
MLYNPTMDGKMHWVSLGAEVCTHSLQRMAQAQQYGKAGSLSFPRGISPGTSETSVFFGFFSGFPSLFGIFQGRSLVALGLTPLKERHLTGTGWSPTPFPPFWKKQIQKSWEELSFPGSIPDSLFLPDNPGRLPTHFWSFCLVGKPAWIRTVFQRENMHETPFFSGAGFFSSAAFFGVIDCFEKWGEHHLRLDFSSDSPFLSFAIPPSLRGFPGEISEARMFAQTVFASLQKRFPHMFSVSKGSPPLPAGPEILVSLPVPFVSLPKWILHGKSLYSLWNAFFSDLLSAYSGKLVQPLERIFKQKE